MLIATQHPSCPRKDHRMVTSTMTVSEAIRQYLLTFPPEKRAEIRPALDRFLRDLGIGDRYLDRLAPPDIGQYVESVDRSGADPVKRLEPVKQFLVWAKQQGLIQISLAPHVRIRRPSSRKTPVQELRDQPTIELTAEGRDQLQQELDRLIALRPEIADEIGRAMADKDFRENAPLDAARDRQAQVEARIRELQRILKAARIVDATTSNARVAIGTRVVLHDIEYDEEMVCQIVGANEADPRNGKLSNVSPIGKAIMDRTVGEEVEVHAPAGVQRFRIKQIDIAVR